MKGNNTILIALILMMGLIGCDIYVEELEQYTLDYFSESVLDDVPGYENLNIYYNGNLSICYIEENFWKYFDDSTRTILDVTSIFCSDDTLGTTLNYTKIFKTSSRDEFEELNDSTSYFMIVSKAVTVDSINNVFLRLKKLNGDELGILIGFELDGKFSKYKVLYFSSEIVETIP